MSIEIGTGYLKEDTLLKAFADFAQGAKSCNEAAEVGEGGVIGKAASTASWYARTRKAPSDNAQKAIDNNNAVRDKLLEALKHEFDTASFDGLPDTVKAALKGKYAKTAEEDFGFEGGMSASGKPLTARRIRAVVIAANEARKNMQNAGGTASANVAKMEAESSVIKLKKSATTKHPKDFDALENYFKKEAEKGASDSLDLKGGLEPHFSRNFTYKIGGKKLKKDNKNDNTSAMVEEMNKMFKGHEKLLDIFDRVFGTAISTMESSHGLQAGESFSPDLSANVVKKVGELEVSKKSEDLFHVVYRKKAENIQSFTIWRNGTPVDSFKCKKADAKGLASYEYSMSFDMKLENDMPVITMASLPEDKYKISVGSFKSMTH